MKIKLIALFAAGILSAQTAKQPGASGATCVISSLFSASSTSCTLPPTIPLKTVVYQWVEKNYLLNPDGSYMSRNVILPSYFVWYLMLEHRVIAQVAIDPDNGFYRSHVYDKDTSGSDEWFDDLLPAQQYLEREYAKRHDYACWMLADSKNPSKECLTPDEIPNLANCDLERKVCW